MGRKVVVLLAAALASTAAAGKGAVSRQEELLPSNNLFPKQEIAKNIVNARVTPYNNPKLYFEIGLPKNFESQPLQVGPDVLGDDQHQLVPMARFEPKANPDDASIDIGYIRPPSTASLKDVVDKFADAMGLTYVLAQQGEFNKRTVFDALLAGKGNKGPVLVRWTLSRRNDYVFAVVSSVLKDKYDLHKKVFGLAAVSFDPTGKPAE